MVIPIIPSCVVLFDSETALWSVMHFVAVSQELNNRLAAEITRLRTLLTGDGDGEAASSPLTQGKDAYELEVVSPARLALLICATREPLGRQDGPSAYITLKGHDLKIGTGGVAEWKSAHLACSQFGFHLQHHKG